VMHDIGCYASENPLIDVGARMPVDLSDDDHDDRLPTMPDSSGVEAPRSRKRLTDTSPSWSAETGLLKSSTTQRSRFPYSPVAGNYRAGHYGKSV
jgi:hypothetical protein